MTDTDTVTLSGSASPGASVTAVFGPSNTQVTVTAGPDGSFTIPMAGFQEGYNLVIVTASLKGSSTSTSLSVTKTLSPAYKNR